MYRNRRWPAIAFGYGVFFFVLGPLTAFVLENTAPVNRPLVVRLAVVFVIAVILIHLRRYSRGEPLWELPSDFERALSAERPPVKLHPEFAKLRDEVAGATAQRSSFERGLWPRLRRLAEARNRDAAAIETASFPNRRGPSARQLADLIGWIEGCE